MRTRDDLTEPVVEAVLRDLVDELSADPETAACAEAIRSARAGVVRSALRSAGDRQADDEISSQIYPFA